MILQPKDVTIHQHHHLALALSDIWILDGNIFVHIRNMAKLEGKVTKN